MTLCIVIGKRQKAVNWSAKSNEARTVHAEKQSIIWDYLLNIKSPDTSARTVPQKFFFFFFFF